MHFYPTVQGTLPYGSLYGVSLWRLLKRERSGALVLLGPLHLLFDAA